MMLFLAKDLSDRRSQNYDFQSLANEQIHNFFWQNSENCPRKIQKTPIHLLLEINLINTFWNLRPPKNCKKQIKGTLVTIPYHQNKYRTYTYFLIFFQNDPKFASLNTLMSVWGP